MITINKNWALGVGVAALLMLGSATSGAATTILIDFGAVGTGTTNPSTGGHYWNNVTGGPGGPYSLIDDTGASLTTTVSLATIAGSASQNGGSGSLAPSPNPYYPGSSYNDYIYIQSGSSNTRITFSNLALTSTYTFKFYASRSGAGATENFAVAGGNSGNVSVNPNNNSTIVQVADIAPTVGGQVVITWTNTTGQFAYLNFMEIVGTPVPEPSAVASMILGGGLLAFMLRFRRRSLV
jgi:hypothetical protein